jgi:hypothetical protein
LVLRLIVAISVRRGGGVGSWRTVVLLLLLLRLLLLLLYINLLLLNKERSLSSALSGARAGAR